MILIVILLHTITLNVFIDIIFSFYQSKRNHIYPNITQKEPLTWLSHPTQAIKSLQSEQ